MRPKLYRGKWYAVWREDGRTRRAALRVPDREAAERRIADLRRKPAAVTVSAIVDAYLIDKPNAVAGWSPGPIKTHFGNLRPDQITRPLSRLYMAKATLDGQSDWTQRRALGALKTALRWAGHAAAAEQLEMPAEPESRDRYLTHAEFDALVTGADAEHVRLFIELTLATGARPGAVLGMKWSQVDWTNRLVRRGKGRGNKKRATVPMTDRIFGELWLAFERATTDYVIEWGGQPVKSVRTGFGAACARAGLGGVVPYTIRHTAATWMAQKRVPMEEIAAFLGHSNPRTTYRIYAKYSPDYLRGAASALDR